MTHTQANLNTAELLSALVDGDLDARVVMNDLDNSMRADWKLSTEPFPRLVPQPTRPSAPASSPRKALRPAAS